MTFYTNVNLYGNTVFVRGIDELGESFAHKQKYSPTLWYPTADTSAPYKSIQGEPIVAKEFGDVKSARDFIKANSGTFPIYGSKKFEASFIQEFYPDAEKHVDYSKIRMAVVDIEVFSPDEFPKPEEAAYPINAITHYDNINDKYYVLHLLSDDIKWDATTAVINEELSQDIVDKVLYKVYDSEKLLLEAYVKIFEAMAPNIFVGWNSNGFDIPYIVNRVRSELGEGWVKRLSPWKIILEQSSKTAFGQQQQEYNILGVSNLDYMEVYKKQTFVNQEFYTLDHIAHVELGEGKVSYDQLEGLHGLYLSDPQKFISYNIKDVVLINKLEEKKNLLKLVMSVAYFAGINYADTFSPIRTWESIIYNEIVPKGIIPPIESGTHHHESYAGGYVKAPLVGMYKQIATFDLTSLYPSIIRQWNISPDTVHSILNRGDISDLIVNRKIEPIGMDSGYCLSANGVTFNTETQGFSAYLMEKLFNERNAAKKEMFKAEHGMLDEKAKSKPSKERIKELEILKNQYATKQMALKILLNSYYGATASPYFAHYDVNLAEAVTLTGQAVIKIAERSTNEYINKLLKTNKDYVVAIDTDSIMINMEDIVSKCMPTETDLTKITDFLDGVCKKIESDCIKPAYKNLQEYLNCREGLMHMDREKISAQGGFFVAKKRYAILVNDNEGVRYTTPELKITGLEIVKKDTPEIIRNELKRLVQLILETHDNDRLIVEIDNFKKKFIIDREFSYDDIAQVKSVSNINKYMDVDGNCTKGTPKNSRAAITYNRMIDSKGLNVQKITNGNKIKMLNLKVPNTAYSPVIAYVGQLPPEFGLDKYIDFETTFQKAFMAPITAWTHAIGWNAVETSSLEDWF